VLYRQLTPALFEMYAARLPVGTKEYDPFVTVAVVVNHWLPLVVAVFTTVQLLAAKVEPASKPPSPVGDIIVVCATKWLPANASTAPIKAVLDHPNAERILFECVFLFMGAGGWSGLGVHGLDLG